MKGMAAPALSLGASLRWYHIQRFLDTVDPQSVLEVGCGLGATGYRLALRHPYRAYEPDPSSATTAAATMAGIAHADIRAVALPSEADETFDLLVAFEVLEHLEEDVEALRLWREWTNPGGYLMFSVPAGPHRMGPWDERVGHFRRYSRIGLETVLAESGWEPVSIRAWGMPLGYLLEWIRHWVARISDDAELSKDDRTAKSGRLLQPTRVLAPAIATISAPFALLQVPFATSSLGIGFVVLARNSQT